MIYLATPYSHDDPAVMQARFEAVNAAAAELMSRGQHVFSPISHSHPISVVGDLPVEWDYWEAYDKRLLAICDQLYVLTLDGWQESVGVAAEMKLARSMGKPVRFYDPERA
jgi:hypothetical protein